MEDSGNIGESTPFIEFMLEILQTSLQDYIKQSQKLGEKLGKKLGHIEVKLTKNRKLILESISKNHFITIAELSKILKISTTTVENNIKYLKQNNLLKRIGSDSGGNWEIIL